MKKIICIGVFCIASFFMWSEDSSLLNAKIMDTDEFDAKYNLFEKIIADTKSYYEVDLYFGDNVMYDFQKDDFSVLSVELNQQVTSYIVLTKEERERHDDIPCKVGFFIITYITGYKWKSNEVFYNLETYILFDAEDPFFHKWIEPFNNSPNPGT